MNPFIEALTSTGETTLVECKGNGDKKTLLGGIAKAALGFANNRNGGRILVGAVQERDGRVSGIGLTELEFDTFDIRNLDTELTSFGSPPMRVRCEAVYHDEKTFIGVTVLPFNGAVTVCRRSTESKTPQVATIYVRGDNAIESRPARADDLAELVQMAVEFQLRAEVAKLVRAGVFVVNAEIPTQSVDARQRYVDERGDF